MSNQLDCISPLDGRYHKLTKDLASITSEKALIHNRLLVEIAWLEQLSSHSGVDCPKINASTASEFAKIKQANHALLSNIAKRVKEIEKSTMHDVKACEYYLQELVKKSGNEDLIPWIHFACTSEDINNTAYALILSKSQSEYLLPELCLTCSSILKLATENLNTAMLGYTHGQAASPTTFGKELMVFVHRLIPIVEKLAQHKFSAKFNGAVGNHNAHVAAYPKLDWPSISKQMLKNLGLEYNALSTQISNHDNLVEFLSLHKQAMTILHDLTQDMWLYAHKNYIILKKEQKTQVGSSTMPHKINPIDFENAEGNIGIYKALANHLMDKLPVSRLQRDLSDSTSIRNLGSCFAHASIACKAITKGINKVSTNNDYMLQELDQHWEVLTEAVQTIMRKHGIKDAYELMKQASQGQQLNANAYACMLDKLEVSDQIKTELVSLTPELYLGRATEQAELMSSARRFLQQFILDEHG